MKLLEIIALCIFLAIPIGIMFLIQRSYWKHWKKIKKDLLEERKWERILFFSDWSFLVDIDSQRIYQYRGWGVLVLTVKGVYFECLYFPKSVKIKLSGVKKVGLTRGFHLLKLSFENESIQSDRVIWFVPNAKRWGSESRENQRENWDNEVV